MIKKLCVCTITAALLTGCGATNDDEIIGNVSVNDQKTEALQESQNTDDVGNTENKKDTRDQSILAEDHDLELKDAEEINKETDGVEATQTPEEVDVPDYVIEEQSSTKSSLFKELDSIPTDADIQAMSSESNGWGQGVQTDDLNRPGGCLQFQQKYGEHSVRFIMDDSEEKNIYLTFDEGYENGYTGQILDTLKEKNVKAVFFVTMDYVKKEPELVQRMIDEGHVVGNHSVTHPSKGLPSLSIQEQENEIMELHNYVKENFGYEMYLFRCPAGIFSEQTLGVFDKCGYTGVFWSFAFYDWDPENQMAQDVALEQTVSSLHPGAIYLLHAVSSTNTAILGDFIDQAQSQGYTFK